MQGIRMSVRQVLAAAAVLSALGATPVTGETMPQRASAAMPTDFSAQAWYEPRGRYEERRPPRIRVRPGGRLLYRDCKFWLAQEHRPSGTVIVPRQHCWWVRG
jgi:hypothetical protein